MKFVRKEVGDQAILPKVPMFQQDMEHILDCVGIKTQSDLQREQTTNYNYTEMFGT